MEKFRAGWDKWVVSFDFIETALARLKAEGVKEYQIVYAPNTCHAHDYCIFYYKDREENNKPLAIEEFSKWWDETNDLWYKRHYQGDYPSKDWDTYIIEQIITNYNICRKLEEK